jgi:hypothetical protein
MPTNRTARILACLRLAIIVSVGTRSESRPQTDAPEVIKVAPPNWWIDRSINPVQVMVRGRRLGGARVESPDPGLTITRVGTNPAGTYLFADVRISANARPGRRSLRIIGSSGEAEAPFEVLPPLREDTRLQGFSPDDVIYLLMPDRFSDADPSNDDPAKSRGLFDRQKSHYYHGGDFQCVINHLPWDSQHLLRRRDCHVGWERPRQP